MIISYINRITPIAGCQEEKRVANLKFLERNGGWVVRWLGGSVVGWLGGWVVRWLGGWGVESGHEGRKQKAEGGGRREVVSG